MTKRQQDRQASIQWARELLARPVGEVALLDTETTGIKGDIEIVSLAVIGLDGTVLFDSLIKPDYTRTTLKKIPEEVSDIHGLTDEMLVDSPSLMEVLPQIEAAIHGKTVIIYNQQYDYGVIWQCLYRRYLDQAIRDYVPTDVNDAVNFHKEARGKTEAWLGKSTYDCCMLAYSAFIGEPGRFGDWKWQRLPSFGDKAHHALSDCVSTLEVIKLMAAAE